MYEIFEELLKKTGVKTADVARATGLAPTTFSDWKSGKSSPKQDKMQLIADYFGVSIYYLLNGKEKDMSFSKESELWISVRHDKELLNAIEKYLNLSEEKKKHVIDTINMLSED
jgi:transcriptional regulator with XRE-family HTH domain